MRTRDRRDRARAWVATCCLALVAACAAASDTPRREITLSGRVVDDTGRPIDRALVEAFRDLSSYEERRLDFGVAPEPIGVGRTDAEGEYSLETDTRVGLVRVTPQDGAAWTLDVAPSFGSMRLPILQARTGEVVTVGVVDGAGRPAADARVRLIQPRPRHEASPWRVDAPWLDVEPSGVAQAHLVHRARARIEARVPVVEDGDVVGWFGRRQPLTDGGRVAVDVPESTLRLKLRRGGKALTHAIFDQLGTESVWRTTAEGSLLLRVDEPPAFVRGLLSTDTMARRWGWTEAAGEVWEAEVVEPELVGVRVMDADGVPIAGAVLETPLLGELFWADDAGRAVVPSLRRLGFMVHAPGRRSQRVTIAPSSPATLEATPHRRSRTELVVEMEPSATVVGQVLDAEGQPIRDVEATAYVLSAANWHSEDRAPSHGLPAVSDASGRLTFGHLAPGEPYVIWLRHRESVTASFRVAPLRAGETRQVSGWRLEPAPAVEGLLTTSDGRPIVDAPVSLELPYGARKTRDRGVDKRLFARETRSGPDGRFRLLRAAPDATRLEVDAPGRPVWRMDIAAGSTADLGRLRVPEGGGSRDVTAGLGAASSKPRLTGGRFVDLDGRPIETSVEVQAMDSTGRSRGAVDVSGSVFVTAAESSVDRRLVVSAPWSIASPRDLPLTSTRGGRVVALRPSPGATGIVYDARGRPVHGAEVERGRGHRLTSTDREGRFELEASPSTLEVWHLEAGHATWQRSKDWQPGQPIVVRLQPGPTITGRIVDPSGRPLGDLGVTAGGADFGARTAPDGTFIIDNAPPDFGQLRVFREGCTSIWLDEMPAAELRDLEIVVVGCALGERASP